MAEALSKVPDVEIDSDGKFKYILVKLKVKDGEAHKNIVRGTKSAEFHSKFARNRLATSFQCYWLTELQRSLPKMTTRLLLIISVGLIIFLRIVR